MNTFNKKLVTLSLSIALMALAECPTYKDCHQIDPNSSHMTVKTKGTLKQNLKRFTHLTKDEIQSLVYHLDPYASLLVLQDLELLIQNVPLSASRITKILEKQDQALQHTKSAIKKTLFMQKLTNQEITFAADEIKKVCTKLKKALPYLTKACKSLEEQELIAINNHMRSLLNISVCEAEHCHCKALE